LENIYGIGFNNWLYEIKHIDKEYKKFEDCCTNELFAEYIKYRNQQETIRLREYKNYIKRLHTIAGKNKTIINKINDYFADSENKKLFYGIIITTAIEAIISIIVVRLWKC